MIHYISSIAAIKKFVVIAVITIVKQWFTCFSVVLRRWSCWFLRFKNCWCRSSFLNLFLNLKKSDYLGTLTFIQGQLRHLCAYFSFSAFFTIWPFGPKCRTKHDAAKEGKFRRKFSKNDNYNIFKDFCHTYPPPENIFIISESSQQPKNAALIILSVTLNTKRIAHNQKQARY